MQSILLRCAGYLFAIGPVLFWYVTGVLQVMWLATMAITITAVHGVLTYNSLVSDHDRIPSIDMRLARFEDGW